MAAADGERPNPVAPGDEVGGGRWLEHEGGTADRFEGKQEHETHRGGLATAMTAPGRFQGGPRGVESPGATNGVAARTEAWWSSTHGGFGSMAWKGDHGVMLDDQGMREKLEAMELSRRFVVVVEALSRWRNNPAAWSLLAAAGAALQRVVNTERQGKRAAVAVVCSSQLASQQASKQPQQQSKAAAAAKQSKLHKQQQRTRNGRRSQ
jgi:hypothetical protein